MENRDPNLKRRRLKNEGRCQDCGKKIKNHIGRCKSCRTKHAESQKKLRRLRKGLCRKCGINRAPYEYLWCPPCLLERDRKRPTMLAFTKEMIASHEYKSRNERRRKAANAYLDERYAQERGRKAPNRNTLNSLFDNLMLAIHRSGVLRSRLKRRATTKLK